MVRRSGSGQIEEMRHNYIPMLALYEDGGTSVVAPGIFMIPPGGQEHVIAKPRYDRIKGGEIRQRATHPGLVSYRIG
ncbi:MAG: hypothetical protein P8M22_12810 [Phycisphaerales bacterium]|nr:hypothetical protein [Phycisphaerales bacterium]